MSALIARLVIGWLALVELVTVALGFVFKFHPLLGGLRLSAGYVLYIPGQFVMWYPVINRADHWMLHYAVAASLLFAAVLLIFGYVHAYRMRGRGDTGSRISSPSEARARLR